MVQDLLRVLVAHLVGHVGQLVRGAHLRGERLARCRRPLNQVSDKKVGGRKREPAESLRADSAFLIRKSL